MDLNPEYILEQNKPDGKKVKKQIQLERTRAAFERLQLAWLRTSLTLLTIGVGSYEYFYNRIEAGKEPLLKYVTGRELGLFLIATPLIVLFLATKQHIKRMASLKKYYPDMRYSVATLLSYLLLTLTFFLGWMVILTI